MKVRLGFKNIIICLKTAFTLFKSNLYELNLIRTAMRRKYLINKNQKLTVKLCEFLGAFIGDGFTAKYLRCGFTQFTGDARYDKKYYIDYFIPLSKEIFNNIGVKVKEHGNIFRVNYYSTDLFEFLTERFSFPTGKKVYSVLIPKEIISSGKKFIFATLRGIFDADGHVYFDCRQIYKKPYLRIELKLANKNLILQIEEILNKEGFSPYVCHLKESSHLYVYNKNAGNFVDKIGFSNSRHLERLKNISK